jgi:hypothetical protein
MFDRAGLDNPFGHSGRRISDFWAGLNRDWSDAQSWKRLRRTPYDHNPPFTTRWATSRRSRRSCGSPPRPDHLR